jgi:uncharacterized protein (DUF488 family)
MEAHAAAPLRDGNPGAERPYHFWMAHGRKINQDSAPPTLYTIGHSTRTLDALIEALQAHGVKAVADVRRFPGSRRLPWFNDRSLAGSLPEQGLLYWPFPDLGGRRRPLPDSPNAGWRNASFRGYADYMMSQSFLASLESLAEMARATPAAIMCAEAVPWRCHRSLIADAMLVRGWRVMDIFDAAKASPHKLTPFAQVRGMEITYPPPLFDEGPKDGRRDE